ncbi:MFS transporter [Sporomusa sp.]|uniref:MFS transporter n=1 Tax=Sporomusa sp. TaxID=2078658 RepID=UPI002C54EEF7|nr:MFS transporter [Sporomusa sp.]HWR09399.1 MFS transporter [Sporomusa sp.]
MNVMKSELKTKAAVLSVALLLYTSSMTTPAIGAIAKAFPDVSPELIKQVAALPPLMTIVGALLTGQLEQFMKKKTILYFAIAIEFLFGGIIPAVYGDMTFILVCRAIFGLGYGLIFPLASSLVADLFEGQERDAMMGLKSAIGAAAGIVFQMIGGYLAVISWRYAFWGFLLLIPIFIVIALVLPEPARKPKPSAANGFSNGRLTRRTWYLSILNLLYNIVLFSFMTNVAIVMAEGKIGNAAQAGVVLTAFTSGAFATGLLYGKIAQIFREYTAALAVGLVGLAFLILVHVHTYPLFVIAGIVFGLGFGIYNPALTLLVVGSAHQSAATLAVSIYIALQGVGQFLSPIVLAFVTKILGFHGPKAAWLVAGPTLIVTCAVIILVTALLKLKSKTVTNS